METCSNTYIRSIRDQFPKENFLVGIESIDDERHELGNFCLKSKGLHLLLSMVHFLRHLEEKRLRVSEWGGPEQCVTRSQHVSSTGVTHELI